MPPAANSFLAEIDTTLIQQVLEAVLRQREPDIAHRRPADDLARRLPGTKGVKLIFVQVEGPPFSPERVYADSVTQR
jgi:hypothetical protein